MLQLEKIHDDEMRIMMLDDYMNEDDPLIRSSKYGAIAELRSGSNEPFVTKLWDKIVRFLRSECSLSIVVIIFGILATLTSTYFNVKGFQDFTFWSPCIRVFVGETP